MNSFLIHSFIRPGDIQNELSNDWETNASTIDVMSVVIVVIVEQQQQLQQ